MRILDPWEELVPLVGPMHGQAKSLPLLLRGVGERDGGLHDDMEELVTLLGEIILAEGSDQLHGLQRAIDLVGGGIGAPEHRRELVVDPGDLRAAFVTIAGRQFSLIYHREHMPDLLTSCRRPTGHQHTSNLIPSNRPMMSRQSATISAGVGGSNRRE